MRTWSRTGSRTSVRTFDRTESGGLPPVVSDPDFEYTTLLLPGNGTNGAQNNTFLDSSTNAFSITRNGNTTQGTFSPFSQTGWGNYFDGSGDYLSQSTNITLGTNSYTIEFWVYQTARGASPNWFDGVFVQKSGATRYSFLDIGGGEHVWYVGDGTTRLVNINLGTLPPLNSWNHYALVRSGNDFAAFVNGNRVGTATSTYSIPASTFDIGWIGTADGYLTGYISNFRVVNGTAVYSPSNTTLTVPTTPLTAITNTSLLTCQANRFLDASSNAFAITRNGDVSVQAFSPFNPTASWNAATYGGSGYFDGSGDVLTIANNAAFNMGSGDCTFEAWVYPTSYAAARTIFNCFDSSASAGYSFSINTSGYINFESSSGGYQQLIASSNPVPLNAWSFIAFTRTSGTNRIFVNGSVCTTTGTLTNNIDTGSQTLRVGQSGFGGGSNAMLGFLSDVRVLKGTGGATSTVPTAPLTAITNTQLLCRFTNAGIYDATSKNDLETVGNAQISTTQSKFGGSSMYFDGTGDWLQIPASRNLEVSGDVTIEFWVYWNSIGNIAMLFGWGAGTTGKTFAYTYSDGRIGVGINGTNEIASAAGEATTGAWTHIAIVRNGSTTTIYKNGTSIASNTTAIWYASTGTDAFYIAGSGSVTDTNAYIQDFRITKGVARYTSNFTAPTAAFPLF
jgi:hypothetical protein